MRRRLPGLTAALAVAAAPFGSAPPTPEEVRAEVRAADALFSNGRHADGLTMLEALAIRIGPSVIRDYPLVLVMISGGQFELGRFEAALSLLDRVVREAVDAEALEHARTMRETLLGQHFGALQVECGEAIGAVRLVERREVRLCPASWEPLRAGTWTIDVPGHRDVAPLSVDVVAGTSETTIALPPAAPSGPEPVETADPPARFKAGLAVGGGIATIGDRSAFVPETSPGPAARLSGRAGWVLVPPYLDLVLDLGLAWSVMRYAAALDGGRVDVEQSWWTAEASVLGGLCHPFGAMTSCLRIGLSSGWLMRATEDGPAGDVEIESGRSEVHLGARAALEVAWPVGDGDVDAFVGLHGLWSEWPGALIFANGSLPYVRMWLDVGVLF